MSRGGKREGAGRKKGGRNALPLGMVQAVKVAGLRVPEGAPTNVRELADVCQQRMIDVMMQDVDSFHASGVLKAATALREELLGPLAKKHEVTGAEGGALVVNVVKYDGDDE